ncbi:phospho-N-acetylmuramoyl-pentapeptide-transferase [Candidatus Synchoanobacter obligatus]|uniref:Phospho-N-acetylmuramoyl-pentapeptide-transferase n=1 Tax=Candidatus Synchoanobacter obligatus TaxID=2919597 RepID=A0ABT1L5U4_9GAMM|nr:phospho-N-acetylmuramoyl-pentapeptide-transferase [Candidatus Synchoanobacter obligatus]MCP8352541.1 phospho-N-acetylmuramoyl-pentapeptide-transferase [Candidatus Synchoanobacter obligatus]
MYNILISLIGHYVGRQCLLGLAQPIREDGPKSHLKKSVPTMGGLIFILLTLVLCFQSGILSHPLCQVLVGYGFLGLYDDGHKVYYGSSQGISASRKFLYQWGLAFAVVSQLPVHPLNVFGYVLNLGGFFYIFSSFIIVASSNAFNLTDGIDGLAVSQGILVLLFFGVLALATGSEELVTFSMILISSLVGFMCFNLYPAKLFMGDVGSLAVGAVLGLYAVLLHCEILYALVALVMVIETISVILQVYYYKRYKVRVFKMAPIHHHFEIIGWSETKIVVVFGLVTLFMVGVSGLLYGL